MKIQIKIRPVKDYTERNPKEFIGQIWLNDNRVYNIPRTEEDCVKSIQYFGNVPQVVTLENQGVVFADSSSIYKMPTIDEEILKHIVNTQGSERIISVELKAMLIKYF